LKWGREQSGKIRFNRQKLCLKFIVEDTINVLNPIARSKKIKISNRVDDHIYVYADLEMLKTVFRNLISNSLKFTNKNGSIIISAEENCENVTTLVADNGMGMDSNNLQRLFDISQRQTTRDLEGENGTGLGLILCKDFISQHGGKIWAVSEDGKGCEFRFTLPIPTRQKVELSN
jgi:signal transduction histidine kinase